MSRSEPPPARSGLDLPAWLLLAWVVVMGTLYMRSMAAERGAAMLAPVASIAARLGLASH